MDVSITVRETHFTDNLMGNMGKIPAPWARHWTMIEKRFPGITKEHGRLRNCVHEHIVRINPVLNAHNQAQVAAAAAAAASTQTATASGTESAGNDRNNANN